MEIVEPNEYALCGGPDSFFVERFIILPGFGDDLVEISAVYVSDCLPAYSMTMQNYSRLFKEVDIDHDGFISYEDYFIFLREYFGSQSEAGDSSAPNPPAPAPTPKPPTPLPDASSSADRFARLIYLQLKITLMEYDRGKNLYLELADI
ncbi:unnamed protein product [Sphagnum balticum]